jgi:ABC-type bacteriocin/lantibiotic exporter with double-glycine peptidase domain
MSAAGGATILDVATLIIASVKLVGVAILIQPLFLLLGWIIRMPARSQWIKDFPLERTKGQGEKKPV